MRWLLGLTPILSVLSTAKAFPATKNDPPILIVEEEDANDSLGPVPNIPASLKQDDGPLQKHALVMDEKSAGYEEDDMVISKRRPAQDAAWPKSGSTVEIPYTASGVDTKVLQRAIEVFNAKTCVRFVERASQSNYVQFQSGSSCSTLVGHQSDGMQTCDLTSGCAAKKGKVMHEMMHVLGFLHEQCRPDRDSYVTVHTDRIKSAALPNFDKVSDSVDQGISYDCDSILHYRSTAFAITSGQETITSSHCSHLGNGDTRLSLLDYKRVNTLYSCGKPTYKYYKVVVVTDGTSLSGAGTDCYIYLTLHDGSQNPATEFELDLSTNPSANLFETGSTDTFNYMAYRDDLGSITGISVRMVAHGSGQAWWPNTFTVTDPASGTSVTFTNSKWLYPSSTYGKDDFPTQ